MSTAPPLFHLAKVKHVEAQRRVQAPNTNNAEYVFDDKGESWVLKRDMVGFNCVLAEALSYCLSLHLKIPTPEAALYEGDASGALWMTKLIPNVLHWMPTKAHLVRNIKDVAAMLVLDAVVGNNDRHAGNILLEHVNGEYDAHSIDMEQSWLGSPQDLVHDSSVRTDLPRLNPDFARLVPIKALAPHMFEAAAVRFEALTRQSVSVIVCTACGALEDMRDEGLFTSAIHARCQMATRLVKERILQFERAQ